MKKRLRQIPFFWYALSVVAIIWYFFVFSTIEMPIADSTVFFTPDSKEYKEVSEWIFKGKSTIHTTTRPILYPALMFLLYKIAGAWGIVAMHILMWLASFNFICLSIFHLTKKYSLTILGGLVFLLNISLITMTLHALTEVTTVFLLSFSFAYFVWKNNQLLETKTIHILLLLLVALTLVKPLFYLPLIAIIFIILPLFYFKKYKSNPKSLIYLLLIISPLLLQLAIMKVKHNEMTVSTISSFTVKNFYFLRGFEEIENIDREQAEELIVDYKTEDQMSYILNHKKHYWELLFRTMEDNIKNRCSYLIITKKNEGWSNYMIDSNDYYYSFHKIFLSLFLPLLLLLFYLKDFASLRLILFSGLIVFYILLTSGISYWQGDRLVLPAIGIWIPLYIISGYVLVNSILSTIPMITKLPKD